MAIEKFHIKLQHLLSIPREIMQEELFFDQCPHEGRFDVRDEQCEYCDKHRECFWMVKNDEFSSQNPKPLWQQKITLDFAIEFMCKKIKKWGHHRRTCQCDACKWIISAQKLSVELNRAVDSE